MNGLLVRVGIDQTSRSGRWNGPCTVDGQFTFVPILEEQQVCEYILHGRTSYDEIAPKICGFLASHPSRSEFPTRLLGRDTHLDPDFDTLTYGDDKKRGRELPEFAAGDFLAFYGAFRRIGERRPRPLIYGLIGYFEARGPGQRASEITDAKTRMENAHT